MRALKGQADANLRTDALLAQGSGQLISAAVELVVSQCLPGEGQRARVRRFASLFGKQLMNGVRQVMLARLLRQTGQQLLAFSRFKQW